MDWWMTSDLTPFKSNSVISGRREMVMKRCVQRPQPHLHWKDFRLKQISNPEPLGQLASTWLITYWATGPPTCKVYSGNRFTGAEFITWTRFFAYLSQLVFWRHSFYVIYETSSVGFQRRYMLHDTYIMQHVTPRKCVMQHLSPCKMCHATCITA